jgi:hypothetical protein
LIAAATIIIDAPTNAIDEYLVDLGVVMFQVSRMMCQYQTSRESDQFLSFFLPKREL